jgi:hypothetical protein
MSSQYTAWRRRASAWKLAKMTSSLAAKACSVEGSACGSIWQRVRREAERGVERRRHFFRVEVFGHARHVLGQSQHLHFLRDGASHDILERVFGMALAELAGMAVEGERHGAD